MPKNFWWLFAAYSVIWIALLGYVARLMGKQRHLRRDFERLRGERGSRS